MKQFVFWISFWESLILWIIHHFLFPFNLDCPVFGQIYWSLPLCTLFPLLSRTQKRHETLAVGQNKWKSSAAGDCFLHSRRAEGPAFYPRLIIWSVIKWRSLKNVCSLKKKKKTLSSGNWMCSSELQFQLWSVLIDVTEFNFWLLSLQTRYSSAQTWIWLRHWWRGSLGITVNHWARSLFSGRRWLPHWQ